MTSVCTLVVPPFIGEFGWELMNWQGRVRWLARHGPYDRIILCAAPDRRALYRDLCPSGQVVFCPMPTVQWPGLPNEDHRVDAYGAAISPADLAESVERHVRCVCERLGVDLRVTELLMPEYRGRLWPSTRAHQLFVNLRVASDATTDIVIVPRRRRLADERNLPRHWWEELASVLRAGGLVVEMYEPRIDHAVRQLSRARLAIGASTGGLHLASLCGCPHYVWGSGPEARWTRMRMTNRQRYETIWNPLGTPCFYDESGWRPAVGHVAQRARHALHRIGLNRRRSSGLRRCKPKWRLKRGLARFLVDEPRKTAVPWPVQNLVRMYLV